MEVAAATEASGDNGAMAMLTSSRDLEHPLEEWAQRLNRMQWSAVILDPQWRLQWVSSSLLEFLRVDDNADLGYGLNIAEAWSTRNEWLETATPESQLEMFGEIAPLFVRAMSDQGLDAREVLGEPFASLVDQVEPAAEIPLLWSSSFEYRDPNDPELPGYGVNFCGIRVNDDEAHAVGIVLIFFIDINPNLMTMLVRGDQAMHERMARLIDPQPQEAVVLFCDLHESGRLSRELSSAAYFKMIRRLWTGIDAAIATEQGIVGKHAGDGASAFFLAEDLGSASGAAAAAVRAARNIHETSGEVFRDVADGHCLMKVGIHWGGTLYMGQLVPGGRLDVTALGDEVNEAARVQEACEPGRTLASKQLLERLSPEDATGLGIDPEQTRFTILGELRGASDKARRDAGGLPVSFLD